MAIRYTIDTDRGIIWTVATGRLTDEELTGHKTALLHQLRDLAHNFLKRFFLAALLCLVRMRFFGYFLAVQTLRGEIEGYTRLSIFMLSNKCFVIKSNRDTFQNISNFYMILFVMGTIVTAKVKM